MKIAHRLWLSAAFPLLALLFISFQYYRQTLTTGLEVAERQRNVLPILFDLRTLLEQIQKQRTYIPQSIAGRPVESESLMKEGARIQESLDRIGLAFDRHPGPLVARAWSNTQERLAPILKRSNQGDLESFETYTLAAQAIVELFDAVGNESNFSSGVARSTALNLLLSDLIPHLADEVELTRGLTVFHLSIEERSAADINRINRYFSLSKFRFTRVMEKLSAVEDMSPDLARDIGPLRASLDRNFQIFSDAVDTFLKGDAIRQQNDVFEGGKEAWQDTFSIFDRIFKEIEGTLQKKISDYRNDLLKVLAVGFLCILMCAAILFFTITGLMRAINRIMSETERIASGERTIQISTPSGNDEMSSLGRGIAKMYESIRLTEEEIRRNSERSLIIARIAAKLQGEADTKGLSANYLNSVSDQLGIVFGAIYLYEAGPAELRSIAVYAPGREFESRLSVKASQSLLGEALKSEKPILIDGLNERNAAAAEAGFLRILPEVLLLAPVQFEGEALAVIELGLLKPMDENRMQIFEQTLSAFAIRLKSTIARATLEALYSQTQDQAQELEERQRELEASNQDLEQKTQELEQQQVELETINQKLDQQRLALEGKNASIEIAHVDLERAQVELQRRASDLEQASRYKSEFLANMSHELRSPLNGILIFSEILAKNDHGTLTAKEVEFSRSIHSSGTDLLRLIEDILDLSKVEAGRLEISPERFDLDDLLKALEGNLRAQAEGKGLQFRISVDPDVPRDWFTDQHRLNQILRNFLSNALKFTDKGEVALRISKAKSLRDGCGVDPSLAIELAVSDTGIGIKKDDQHKLFVPFQQIDAKSNRRFPGTGLGLSITQKLAVCLGGYVSMESEPGKGSIFRVILPYEMNTQTTVSIPGPNLRELSSSPLDPRELSPAPPPSLPIADDRDSIGVNDRTLLIIEDDRAFAGYLVDNGRALGFKCIVACSGEDGLRDALAFRPSGIILDIKLPGMNGLSVLDRLRSEPATKRIPVHVISAFEYQIEARKHENVDFLKKPISHAQLQTVINKFGSRAGTATQRILVIGRKGRDQDDIAQSIAGQVDQVSLATSGPMAVERLQNEAFDCIIMDANAVQEEVVTVLQKIKGTAAQEALPIIVLSDSEFSPDLNSDISRLANSIIVRGEKAKERLLDEVSLFLHKVESDLPKEMERQLSMASESFQNRQVLLVDDDMRNLFAIMTVLEAQGMIVHTATNGREAIQKLDSLPKVDIVLMDMMMPEVDGYDATREIRKDSRFQNLPIIALTARAMKGEREECLAAGASDYLSKPLKVDQLLTLIKLWLV